MTFMRAAAGVLMSAAVAIATATTAVASPAGLPEPLPLTTPSTPGTTLAAPGVNVLALDLAAAQLAPVAGVPIQAPDFTWIPHLRELLLRGVPVSLRNGDRSAPVLVQVASPQENVGAMQNFSSILGLGSGVGSLLGLGTGAIVGCLVGFFVIPVIGCLPGLITGGGVGGILGSLAGGSLGAGMASLDLVQTMNATDGSTRYYVKPVPVSPAAPAPAK